MKKVIISLLLYFIAFYNTIGNANEYRTVIFLAQENKPITIAPGESFPFYLQMPHRDEPTQKMIRVVGGIKMPGTYASRGETNFRKWEYFIDDYIDSTDVINDEYALLFRGFNNHFPQKAYHRISGELLKSGDVEISTWIKRTDFQVNANGKFGIEVELFYKKEGRAVNDIYDKPDEKLWMSIQSGDEEYVKVQKIFRIPGNVAAAVIVVGGQNFSGDCLVEAPVIKQNGKQVTSIPFVPQAKRSSDFNYWTGINLASRNWPVWKLTIDDKEVFKQAVFDRASDIADFYIPIPDNVIDSCKLALTLVDEKGIASYPYVLEAIEFIEQPAGEFEIISSPDFITAGTEFGLLLETQQPNTHIICESTSGIMPIYKEKVLDDKGLHVVKLKALKPGIGEKIRIISNGKTKELEIGQIIVKNDDHVYLSTGDEIYIDKVEPFYSHYFKWFINNNIGNFYQFRPSYQWSGVRKPDTILIRRYLKILNDLNMPYAWQVEGRTLAGECLNPSLRILSSPVFKGKQAHENDGGYYYWQHFLYEGQYSDMAARTRPYGGIFAKHCPIYTDHGTYIHYDPYVINNMEEGANYLVDNLKYSKGESTRHTGPSTLFRYLYQAGYEWLGAEQMYGPEETILSSLRGASRAYNKKEYGTLHAVQWGSKPYTDPKHSHRFYLSLATAYMQGSSHINTEEGLWTDEYANDRFSESGKKHIAAQKKMLDFIQTHERRGLQVVNVALIQGRNCAWKSFGRTSLWSQKGEKWKFNRATESFDLINVFYPQNTINWCGPSGWFTSTPYGAIDLVPIEAELDVLKKYKTIFFMGWNTYDTKDWERLIQFVDNGGTLVFTAAHLNTNLQPDTSPLFPENDKPIRNLLGDNYQDLKEQVTLSVGKGKVIYFPQPFYPIEDDIRERYTEVMNKEGLRTSQQQYLKGWISTDDKTSFTVWDEGDRRTIYLLNIDWSNEGNSSMAQFHLGNEVYTIKPRSYCLEQIYIKGNLSLMPESNTTDILEIEENQKGWSIKCQTTCKEQIQIFRGDKQMREDISIAEPGIHNIKIRR